MKSPQTLTTEMMQDWLEQAGTDFYLCNQCDGIHLRALQDTQGVIDSCLSWWWPVTCAWGPD